MRIAELMTRDPDVCLPEDSLNRAAQILWERDCGCVPVVDAERRVVGMLTDRDICMAAYTQGKHLEEIGVGSVMSQGVVTCNVHDTPARVQVLMQNHRLRRLPVLDNGRRLIGIVSLADLARCMRIEQTFGGDGMSWTFLGRTLAAVSEPRSYGPPAMAAE
jgi:CBS domain-containing protein